MKNYTDVDIIVRPEGTVVAFRRMFGIAFQCPPDKSVHEFVRLMYPKAQKAFDKIVKLSRSKEKDNR